MNEPVPPVSAPRSTSPLPLIAILLAVLVAPFTLRALNAAAGVTTQNKSYLPSLETRSTRKTFRTGPIQMLRDVDPGFVFIGDSMLGTRIEPRILASETGRHVAFLFQAASGPAWWYLAFKNHLVPSGVKPKVTFFFFRDDNMTDVMYRLRNHLGDALDEVALEREPELDRLVATRQRGAWSGVDRTLDSLYAVETTSAWLHPTIRRWYALWKYPEPDARLHFENLIEEDFNQNFRRDVLADMSATDDNLNFARDLPGSVLPLIMTLARQHDLPICFVRVQRRPKGDVPPPQSAALVRYVDEFKAWAASQGAFFHDDTGDPEMTEAIYEDGDHVDDRVRYTQIFRRRLDALLK